MKKIIFLLILISAFSFGQNAQKRNSGSQEELKKSAETFVTDWIKYFENKNWDAIVNSADADGLLISALEASPLKNSLEGITEYGKKKDNSSKKILIDSLSTEVFGKTSAMVTARYKTSLISPWGTTDIANLDNFRLEKIDGNWKIKTWFRQEYFPTIFSENIESVWNYRRDLLWRFNDAIFQMGNIALFFMGEYKKNGTSPAQLGKIMGARFAEGWNPEGGFDGLASGFTNVIQSLSTNVEVLELNKNTAKFKYDPFFSQMAQYYNLSKQDVLEYFQNAFGAIADKMGSTSSLVEDDKYYLLTLNKK